MLAFLRARRSTPPDWLATELDRVFAALEPRADAVDRATIEPRISSLAALNAILGRGKSGRLTPIDYDHLRSTVAECRRKGVLSAITARLNGMPLTQSLLLAVEREVVADEAGEGAGEVIDQIRAKARELLRLVNRSVMG